MPLLRYVLLGLLRHARLVLLRRGKSGEGEGKIGDTTPQHSVRSVLCSEWQRSFQGGGTHQLRFEALDVVLHSPDGSRRLIPRRLQPHCEHVSLMLRL